MPLTPDILHLLRCRTNAGASARELLDIIENPEDYEEDIAAAKRDISPRPLGFCKVSGERLTEDDVRWGSAARGVARECCPQIAAGMAQLINDLAEA